MFSLVLAVALLAVGELGRYCRHADRVYRRRVVGGCPVRGYRAVCSWAWGRTVCVMEVCFGTAAHDNAEADGEESGLLVPGSWCRSLRDLANPSPLPFSTPLFPDSYTLLSLHPPLYHPHLAPKASYNPFSTGSILPCLKFLGNAPLSLAAHPLLLPGLLLANGRYPSAP